MEGKGVIDHEGRVGQVSAGTAKVVIDSQSACASCHAKGACSAADKTEKVLDVPLRGLSVTEGETVRVQISKRMGLRAVALGYIYPFLVLMVVLVTLTAAGFSELRAGLFALLSLLPYYLVVWLLRDRIANAFTFKLQKTNFDL